MVDEHACPVERLRPHRGAGDQPGCQQPLEPAPSITELPADVPQRGVRTGQPQPLFDVHRAGRAALKHRANVVFLSMQAGKPLLLVRSFKIRLCQFEKLPEVLCVPTPDLILLAALAEPTDGMLSNWLKHEVPVALIDRADEDQA